MNEMKYVRSQCRQSSNPEVKGGNVFRGYLNRPEANKEVLTEGWFHTGDIAYFDDDGFLRIIGRKKEIIITAGGKNIAPKNIEAALRDGFQRLGLSQGPGKGFCVSCL